MISPNYGINPAQAEKPYFFPYLFLGLNNVIMSCKFTGIIFLEGRRPRSEGRKQTEVGEYLLIKAKCGLINTQVQVKICRRGVSPILVYGGAIYESSPSKAQSRKVFPLEEIKIVII